MMKILPNIIVFIILPLVLAASMIVVPPIISNQLKGSCILILPYGELEGGRISVEGGGLFGSGRTVYDLSYPGTCYRSGKKCLVWVAVTKEEYEHQMYGVKR